eukprot:COSAG01_NODE_74_length_28433_cov_41.582269_31_plen_123_part_00
MSMPSSSEHAKTLGPVAAAAANSTATAGGGGGGAGRCRSQKRSRSSSERGIQPQPPAKRSALEDDALLLSPKQYNGGNEVHSIYHGSRHVVEMSTCLYDGCMPDERPRAGLCVHCLARWRMQ